VLYHDIVLAMNMLVVDRMFLLKIKVNRTNELPITETAIISTYKVTMVDCSGLLISTEFTTHLFPITTQEAVTDYGTDYSSTIFEFTSNNSTHHI
jgi:hypothetical protein